MYREVKRARKVEQATDEMVKDVNGEILLPNQKNIYGLALALIAIIQGITHGIIAVASPLVTIWLFLEMAGIHSDISLGFQTCTTHATAV